MEKTTFKTTCKKVAKNDDGKAETTLVAISDNTVLTNNALWNGSPKGKIQLTATAAEHQDFFKPGRQYYVSIQEIPPEPLDAEEVAERASEEDKPKEVVAAGGKKK